MRRAQDSQMLRDGRLGDGKPVGDAGDCMFPPREYREDRAPGRIGKGPKAIIDRMMTRLHISNYLCLTYKPLLISCQVEIGYTRQEAPENDLQRAGLSLFNSRSNGEFVRRGRPECVFVRLQVFGERASAAGLTAPRPRSKNRSTWRR